MKIPKLKTKNLLTVTDLTSAEIEALFEFTKIIKKYQKKGKKHHFLNGKTLGMIFEKSSTRTRVSFEAGIFHLGGTALFLNPNDIQIGRGELISDTARVLSRYIDGIMIRAYEHSKIEELAKYSSIPIINGLTDSYHPCQALTDLFTIYERENNFKNIKLTYIGDGNNMAHSLLLCSAIMGLDIAIATPARYAPAQDTVSQAQTIAAKSGAKITITTAIEAAAQDADYLYTDVWASMGQEQEIEERKAVFSDYKISLNLINKVTNNAKIMHCLPAHRNEEIDADAIESENSIVFDQAENRLHIQKSIMSALMA
jgi:ornithine carbamoyltransferase